MAHRLASSWLMKVSLSERPLRRTWTRQAPDFCLRIEAIFRVQIGCREISKRGEEGRKTSRFGGPGRSASGLMDNDNTLKNQHHLLCTAPMMDWTDRHCRRLHRALSARARLYTEMLTAEAVIHGDPARLLGFDPAEHPVALQLGGSDPARLVQAARIGEALGYDEINLNVGCPSDRVQSGRFGACLMREPDLVADGMAAMIEAVSIPVTLKCRIGV